MDAEDDPGSEEQVVIMASPDELAQWTAEVLYLRMAQFLEANRHTEAACDCAENTLKMWERLHGITDGPPLN